MASEHMKRCSTSHVKSLGNCKLKQDVTTYLLEWPKSKTLTTPNAGKDVEQQELSFMLVGMQNGAATLEESLAVSYKTKHTLTIRSSRASSHTPWYLPKGAENLCPHKTLHMDV